MCLWPHKKEFFPLVLKDLPWARNTDAHGWPWHWGMCQFTLPHGGYWAQSVLKKISFSFFWRWKLPSREGSNSSKWEKNTELDISSFDSSHLWDLFSSTIKWQLNEEREINRQSMTSMVPGLNWRELSLFPDSYTICNLPIPLPIKWSGPPCIWSYTQFSTQMRVQPKHTERRCCVP